MCGVNIYGSKKKALTLRNKAPLEAKESVPFPLG